MASAQQNSTSSDPTDISHVLESLGSLIGELDSCVTEVQDKQGNASGVESNQLNDISLETLLADTDEFKDDEHQYLIPRQRSPVQKSPPGYLSPSDSLSEGAVGGASAETVSSSHPLPLQSENVNIASLRTAEQYYAIPPNRSGHKGAFKDVALSVDLQGSFKKVGEASAVAQKNASHTPSVHTKAEPNHYVAPSELGFQKRSQGYVKPGPGTNVLPNSGQQVKQEKHAIQEVTVTVFNENYNPIGLTVSSNMKAREACLKLALLDKVEADPHWVLTEYLTDLGLERNLEDHENLMAILKTWAPGSSNKLLFRKDSKKYHFFSHTSNYFPAHLLDSENSDKAVTEKAQKAKTILQQKLFSTCTRVPEIEGTLHCKDFGKKSWSKKLIFLRGSGLYSSSKGKSKASKDLECYVQFDGTNLYNILNPKKSHKAPTEFCFCIVPYRARELKELKCLCADDEKTVMSWIMAVRLAKFGPQLRQNYDDMLRKFAKLTRYRDQTSDTQNATSEMEAGEIKIITKEGQVAMDFTGERGKVITDMKEIQQLANTRNKVTLTRRSSSQHFVPTDTAVSGHQFMSEPWYHGRITRERSLELLFAAGIKDGLFLVRESSSVAGVFVLTFCMNRKVYHCQLVQDIGEGTRLFFSLGKGPAFETLNQLIHFYQQKPLNGVSLALRTPCPKIRINRLLHQATSGSHAKGTSTDDIRDCL